MTYAVSVPVRLSRASVVINLYRNGAFSSTLWTTD